MALYLRSSGVYTIVVFSILTFIYFLYGVGNVKDNNHDTQAPVRHRSELFRSSTNAADSTQLGRTSRPTLPIDVLITFTNVEKNKFLVLKFRECINSMLNHTSSVINIHLITDEGSKQVAEGVIELILMSKPAYFQPKIVFIDIKDVVEEADSYVKVLRSHFSSRPGTYFSDSLFFLSPGLHRISLFGNFDSLIILDVDTKFQDDIRNLHSQFALFEQDSLIAMAYEQQPVYRHLLGLFRKEHPRTVIGDSPKTGFPGYNSGVVLMNLTRLRNSITYNQYLTSPEIIRLVNRFHFKGHLGDQDYYTLLSFEFPQFFHTLPCFWNRQLCKWWKHNGYYEEFPSYHRCEGHIKLYHGNCNTQIPNT